MDGADANTIIYTMVEMAKAYNLNVFKYLEFLLSHRPSENMSDEELERIAPWGALAQEQCGKGSEM